MNWFLVISLFASDEVLIKQMNSKEECVKEQKSMEKVVKINKHSGKTMIESISCELGYVDDGVSRKKEGEYL